MLMILVCFRIEQAMRVDDEIAHTRIVDGALRRAFPGVVGCSVVWISADEIDCGQIRELRPIEALEFAADNEMEKLLG